MHLNNLNAPVLNMLRLSYTCLYMAVAGSAEEEDRNSIIF